MSDRPVTDVQLMALAGLWRNLPPREGRTDLRAWIEANFGVAHPRFLREGVAKKAVKRLELILARDLAARRRKA